MRRLRAVMQVQLFGNVAMRYSLGIDIGGTFTDVVVYDGVEGVQHSRKVLTTHGEPERGVIEGVRTVLKEHALAPEHFARVVHATTLFANALIERKGAVTGLITTAGFRDTLEIGRERKYELYDLDINNPPPLVPRDLRVEIGERMRADGRAIRSVDRAELEERVRYLRGRGVQSIAIVFLHSYVDPAHEAEAARIATDCAPELFVTTSHEVVREIREFERTSTTVANAYIKPLAHKYLDRMARELRTLGIDAPLLLMLSNGGLTHIEEAKRVPVRLLESGPAAGALVGAFLWAPGGAAQLTGVRHGRHDSESEPGRRWRAARRAFVRGRAPEAVHRGQRPADSHFYYRSH